MNDLLGVLQLKLQESSSRDVLWSLFAFSAVAMTWTGYVLSAWMSRRHERRMRELRREDRSLEVVFFDITRRAEDDNIATLRSQPLASVSLNDESWDAAHRRLIGGWDSRQQGLLIQPKNPVDAEALADRIYTVASCTLSSSIPAIRGYLQDDQIADERDGFRHVRFLACLTRPHASTITWKDTPRLVIVPVNTARRLTSTLDSELTCKHSPMNRKVWLHLLRDIGIAYRDRDEPLVSKSIATIDIGLEH